jgi:hypothetical protein
VAHGHISRLDSQGKSSKSLTSPSANGSLRALLVLVSRLIGRLEGIDEVGVIGKAVLWPTVALIDWIARKNRENLISPSINGSLRALLILVSRLIGRLEGIEKIGVIESVVLWPTVVLIDWIARRMENLISPSINGALRASLIC